MRGKFVFVCLIISISAVCYGAPKIQLIEPITSNGESENPEYRTMASIIRIVGVVSSDSDITDVTVNGKPAKISNATSRDLILVQNKSAKTVRFAETLTIAVNEKLNVIISARDANGGESSKQFTAIREELDTTSATKLGRRWALIIGIENYQDPNITDLNYSVDDATSLYDVLTDPNRGGFDKEFVRLLTDDAELKPTRRNILSSLRNWLSRTKPEDTVLFYFSGHGIADSKGRNYLVAQDSSLDLLEDTAVSMDRVNELLSDGKVIKARKVTVVLDSCHSGAKVGSKSIGETGRVLDSLFTNAEGRITLASCGIDEQSFEDPEKGHGVFTYYLVEGLKGHADSDLDGVISATEVSNYVFNAVREWAWGKGKKQTPRRESNLAGEIWLTLDPEIKTRRLDHYHSTGQLSDEEYNQAKQLLDKDLSQLTDLEKTHRRALDDLLSGKTTIQTYRLIIMRSQGLGSLKIETIPAGAAIFFGGNYVGVSPITLGEQSEGEYELEITKEGYVPIKTRIKIGSGENKTFSQKLTQYGYVEVVSVPSGGRISVNGRETGKLTPATIELQPGKYTLQVSLPGETIPERTIEIEGGARLKIEFAPGVGSIEVSSDPPGASIFLDGSDTGHRTPHTLNDIPSGGHRVSVRHAEYADAPPQDVSVRNGETARVHFRLTHAGYGQLIVDCSPWAEVYLDGKKVGDTPLWLKQVVVGTHLIKLVNPDHDPIEKRVDIQKGKVERIKVSF